MLVFHNLAFGFLPMQNKLVSPSKVHSLQFQILLRVPQQIKNEENKVLIISNILFSFEYCNIFSFRHKYNQNTHAKYPVCTTGVMCVCRSSCLGPPGSRSSRPASCRPGRGWACSQQRTSAHSSPLCLSYYNRKQKFSVQAFCCNKQILKVLPARAKVLVVHVSGFCLFFSQIFLSV